MLAMADRHGRVWGSIPGLANRARVSVDATRIAIETFMSPDPDSRTKIAEGRRLEEIDGGWKLINHAKYRSIRDEEERRAYKAEHERNRRGQKRGQNGQTCTPVESGGHNAEAEAEAEAIKAKTNTLASTANAVPAERGKLLGTLPCVGGVDYEVREDDLQRDAHLFPGANIPQEYRSMKSWLLADKRRQKTLKGIRRFMSSWLTRAQDQPKGNSNGAIRKSANVERSDANMEMLRDILSDQEDCFQPPHHGSIQGGDNLKGNSGPILEASGLMPNRSR